MKKTLLALALVASMACFAGTTKSSTVHNNVESVATVEQVNDSTLIYRNIERLDVIQTDQTSIIYVYELDSSKLVAASRGTFSVDLSKGNYLVTSTKPFTSAKSDVIIEREQF